MTNPHQPPTGGPMNPRIQPDQAARDAYWKANVRLILILMAIWAIVSYGCAILFVEQLNRITIGQVPLGFWMGHQGSICTFVVLIFVYAWRMDKLDQKYGVQE